MSLALLLGGCAATDTGPINVLSSVPTRASTHFMNDFGDDGALVVGVSFSGGGTRAAAFAYGVLRELDAAVIDEDPRERSVTDSIHMVSGTSGGAVAAAYFGLRGPDGFHDFRERFLLQDVEASMRTAVASPVNLMRAWSGGVNDRGSLADWLDRNLFDRATFAAFEYPDAPTVWLTASDIFNGVPFIFTHDTFAALCSDLNQTRIADAVAASAAVPVVFAPIDMTADSPDCGYRRPEWLERALVNRETPVRLNAHARALDSYRRDDRLATVRLLDGGLTDNIGVTGFALERASADTPHGPLTPAQAVRLQRLLFIVTDAGRETLPEWGNRAQRPRLPELISAVSQTSITASVRNGFDALKLAARQWQDDIIRFRCALSDAQVRRHRGSLEGWNCRDVRISVELLSFRDFDIETQDALNSIPTRLTLPEEQVDLLIDAGRRAVRENAAIRETIAAIRRYAEVRRAPWPEQ
ncbi:MAG: patatin-like phospholipase family protein [Pararhodobacter sp.]